MSSTHRIFIIKGLPSPHLANYNMFPFQDFFKHWWEAMEASCRCCYQITGLVSPPNSLIAGIPQFVEDCIGGRAPKDACAVDSIESIAGRWIRFHKGEAVDHNPHASTNYGISSDAMFEVPHEIRGSYGLIPGCTSCVMTKDNWWVPLAACEWTLGTPVANAVMAPEVCMCQPGYRSLVCTYRFKRGEHAGKMHKEV